MKLSEILEKAYIKFLIYKSDQYSSAEVYRKYYKVKIGKNLRITGKHISFGSEPYLVEIGDDVTISGDVKFETHDGGVAIFRKEYPGMNVFGRIKVGNNVFIGHDSIVMLGVTIGDNAVIGAGSVVTKDVPSGTVAAGVPAQVVESIDDYKAKAMKKAIYVLEVDPRKRKEEILNKLNEKPKKI